MKQIKPSQRINTFLIKKCHIRKCENFESLDLVEIIEPFLPLRIPANAIQNR